MTTIIQNRPFLPADRAAARRINEGEIQTDEHPSPPAAGPALAHPPVAAKPAGRRRWWKRPVVWAAAAAALAGGVVVGGRYYAHAMSHESTDDAFVEGRIIPVSPRVAGHVAQVYVTDNQAVKAGDVLFELDARDFAARLDQAKAALAAAEGRRQSAESNVTLIQTTSSADVRQAEAGVAQAQSAVRSAEAAVGAARSKRAQAEAGVAAAQAAVEQAKAERDAAKAEQVRSGGELTRYRRMSETNAASEQEVANVLAAARSADAQLQAAEKRINAAEAAAAESAAARESAAQALAQSQTQVAQAQAKVAEAEAKRAEAAAAPQRVQVAQSELQTATAEVERLKAALHQAELDLSYTKVTAADSGRVTRKSVEEGTYVQPGQSLLALVPDDLWVVANFKETQLDDIRPGQAVEVEVDAYPGHPLRGHVDSVQRGSGARFSLLPPENATGNYVKVVQRVPVKIVFDEPTGPDRPLGPGMSVVPEVKVK